MSGRSARVGALLMVIAIACGAGAVACGKKADDGTAPAGPVKNLPPLTIRDDTPNLMLTWIDDRGDSHVEMKPADVPASARSPVRVVMSDRDDGTRDQFYVVDLDKKTTDGGYLAETMARQDWEAEIAKRRVAYLAKIAPPPPPAPSRPASEPSSPGSLTPTPAPSGGATVIIYGASWCGPCHQAQDYLRSKGVSVVLKDIEETPGAQREMQEKLTKAGVRGGSIPVIDVRGQILVGFSPRALDQALAKTSSGTKL